MLHLGDPADAVHLPAVGRTKSRPHHQPDPPRTEHAPYRPNLPREEPLADGTWLLPRRPFHGTLDDP